jgi:hypothetical protein
MKYVKLFNCFLNENKIEIPNIPNTMNFWHGGNLDDYTDIIAQKNGRYEFGPGLYITTNYDTAVKYSKGKRKLYIITVEKGVDITDAFLDLDVIMNFINDYVISSKKKEIKHRIQKYVIDGRMKAFIFNNIILNESAVKASNIKQLRQLYVDNNIDYEIVNNAFGWGEDMMVLYNMKKIVNVIQIKPSDQIDKYDLKE